MHCLELCLIHRRSQDTLGLDPLGLRVDDGGDDGEDGVVACDLTIMALTTVAIMMGRAGGGDDNVEMVVSAALVVAMVRLTMMVESGQGLQSTMHLCTCGRPSPHAVVGRPNVADPSQRGCQQCKRGRRRE